MEVNKTFEGPDGSITFQGKLSPEELDLIISVGLNFLLQQGALPIKAMEEDDMASFGNGSEELQ